MRYLLLIYTNEAQDSQATPAEQEAIMGADLGLSPRR